jgi:hypothetical protein
MRFDTFKELNVLHPLADAVDDVVDHVKAALHPPDDDGLRPTDLFEFNKLSRRVCLIRRDDAAELTGCLVGPDLMLTAAHGMLGTGGIFADPATVTILFDQFVWNEKTGTRAQGDSCRLRRIPFTNQPDVIASSIKTDPKCRRKTADNGLDYLLVRLDRPIGLSFLPYSYRIRGWNNCSRADDAPEGKAFVVQHPGGGLQQFADGFIVPNTIDPKFSTLFQYNTTTRTGSSGSPIVNDKKRVVGIHVGERESHQLGVSFQKIFEDLQNEGVSLPPFRLTKEVMDTIFGTSTIEQRRKKGKDWRGDRLFDDVASRDYRNKRAPRPFPPNGGDSPTAPGPQPPTQ